jgi:N-acetylglucosamine-6-phosphate deacetylase
MQIRGRIPGRAGLWQLSCDGDLLQTLECVDPHFTDTRCRWITPGLFDLQINGIAGTHFTEPGKTDDELARADQLIRAGGVSRYCPTLVTCSRETALAALADFRTAWEKGIIPGAWGIHLEGPWISPEEGYRGVHRPEHIRDPDGAELSLFQECAGGLIRVLTLAPERPGAEELIRQAVNAGIVVSLGHTKADEAGIARAVRAGARMSTHLFNGCARVLDRHMNVVFSQLAEDALFGCFIADGHHMPDGTLRIAFRAKGPEKSILVSDLAHLSGLPDGEYDMEGNRVVLREGGIWVKGSWLLSGAARTLDRNVEYVARQEPGIAQSLLMATRNPAAAVGELAWAELAAGRRGPIAVFSWSGANLLLEQRIGF